MTEDKRITPCLWFDSQGEEAAQFYISIFPNSKLLRMSRYTKAGHEIHGKRAGSVMTVEFELDGQPFMALNGGPEFKFSEAISLHVSCETQGEIDAYWTKLSQGGDRGAQQCGWLKDKYGVSWQIVPRVLAELISDPDPKRAGRTMEAMLQMKKVDIAALKRAHAG